jgi:miniconductance mechanosensitive channel
METLWSAVYDWASSADIAAFFASALASAACALAVLAADLALCVALSFAVRRFAAKRNGSRHLKDRIVSFIHAGIWTVFVWGLYAWLPDAFPTSPQLARIVARVLNVATVLLFAATAVRVVDCAHAAASAHAGKRALASKTLAQTAGLLVWFTAAVISAAVVMGKSPAFVLSGLGALTAVLLLIFRDSLLGLVAGVQVSQNDMVRVGDWITMAKYNADGTVIDIALTTVKVRNFDNTVTMIPSSALISDAFVNWRYMSTSKGRRIKRPVLINVSSIRELTPDLRERLVAGGFLEPGDAPVSNLAAFELWLARMLRSHEAITQELTCMVRQTQADDTGIPIEIYAFTKTRDWIEYEAIQTEIFDRIFVTVPKFDLLVYQRTGDKSRLGR